jgi:hypothetical protein
MTRRDGQIAAGIVGVLAAALGNGAMGRAQRAASAPVVANGRAVLECETGIVCLRAVEQE